jgi:RHS repeat-associated protein
MGVYSGYAKELIGHSGRRGTSTLFSLNYDYTTGVPGDNGQIEKITDNMDSTKTTTYSYDAWLRLKSASNPQWTVTETYDRFGNRKSQSAPVLNNVTPSTSTNRLTDAGYAYDAAGNMTSDGSNTMVYDGENRVASAINGGAAGTYTYDGNSLRVQKCAPNCTAPTTTTVYIFSGTKVIAEYDNGAAVGSPSREYIYSGSALLATISGASTTYHHPDHLSERVATDQNGNTVRTYGHYPFGETWYETGAASKLKFTSYERDSESGNDYAMARYNVNRLGRFSSPDPIGGSLADPQSLNRYAYTRNDPINLADPSGLFYYDCSWYGTCGPAGGGGFGGGGGGGGPFDWGQIVIDNSLQLFSCAFTMLRGDGEDGFSLNGFFCGPTRGNMPDPGDAGGAGGHKFVNQKVLAGCIQDLFGVTLTQFTESSQGTNGSFLGRGPDSFSNGFNKP